MMKKFLTIATIMVLTLIDCSKPTGEETDKIKVGLVTDLAGVSDKSFSQMKKNKRTIDIKEN